MTAALRICTACWGLRADEAGGPCVECNARGFTGTLSLAPPVLPPLHIREAPPIPGRCCDYGGECDCDDDEPSAAELHREDSESLDRELASFAWGGR